MEVVHPFGTFMACELDASYERAYYYAYFNKIIGFIRKKLYMWHAFEFDLVDDLAHT